MGWDAVAEIRAIASATRLLAAVPVTVMEADVSTVEDAHVGVAGVDVTFR